MRALLLLFAAAGCGSPVAVDDAATLADQSAVVDAGATDEAAAQDMEWPLACTSMSDCDGGASCCFSMTPNFGGRAGSQCSSDCSVKLGGDWFQSPVCVSDDDCPFGNLNTPTCCRSAQTLVGMLKLCVPDCPVDGGARD